MPNEPTDAVKEARELIADHFAGRVFVLTSQQYDRIPELLKTLCDELEEARAELKERRKEVLDLEDEVSKNHA